jgi:magnesium-transporting ATPase (P-type)
VHIDDIDSVRFEHINCNYLIAEGVAYNSTKAEAVGNATEQGLLRYLMQHEVPNLEDTMNEKAKHIICQIPFDSLRKKGLTVIRHPQTTGKIRVFAKGAPDFMLKDCTQYIGADGHTLELS